MRYLIIFLLGMMLCLPLFAQEAKQVDSLRAKIISAKSSPEVEEALSELTQIFFKENKYNECFDLLNTLGNKKKEFGAAISYYLALCRWRQMKYLEEAQNWDEYFSRGNDYREDISVNLGKAINSTGPKEALHIRARLLFWKFHKDMQDVFWEKAQEELSSALTDFASYGGEIKIIKEAADDFSLYGEKAMAKSAYKLYADRMLASNVSADELSSVASGFYKEGNLELAETLYSAYLDKIEKAGDKEKFISALKDITQRFTFKDDGPNDPSFAEKIYQRLEDAAGKDAFDVDSAYARAFNVEKAREFLASASQYNKLLERFPGNAYTDESLYKIAIITTYVGRDMEKGREVFEKLAAKEKTSAQVIAAIYQLGLLSQWQGDLEKAKDYYNKLLERAAENFPETKELANERLKEIAQGKPIEYNLKTFLDVSLKEANTIYDMSKVELKSYPYRAKESGDVKVSSTAYAGTTGCLQLDVQYLWSGHIGTARPLSDAPEFDTKYTHPGTKEVNLVVVSPSGILDRSIDMVDVR